MRTGVNRWKAMAGLAAVAALLLALAWLLRGTTVPRPASATEPAPASVVVNPVQTPIATLTIISPSPPLTLTVPPPTVTSTVQPPTPAPTDTPGPLRLGPAVQVSLTFPIYDLAGLHGDTAVLIGPVDDVGQVLLVDLVSGQVTQASRATGWGCVSAAVSDAWVVCVEQVESTEHPPAITRLKYYDRATGQEHLLAGVAPRWMELSGDVVVWMEFNYEGEYGRDIRAQDLRTGRQWAIAQRAGHQEIPHISGRWVVYMDQASDRSRFVAGLYAYDLETGEDRMLGRVYTNADRGEYYAVDDGRVVWVPADDPQQVVGLDLDGSGQMYHVLTEESQASRLRLFGNVLTYHGRSGMLYDRLRAARAGEIISPGFLVSDIFLNDHRIVWILLPIENRSNRQLWTATVDR